MWMVNPNHQLVDGQNQTYNGLDLGVDQLTRNLGAALCMVYGEYDYSSWGYVLQMVLLGQIECPVWHITEYRLLSSSH